eukprot:15287328-Ditylum_brightwellii.AAC.1
MEGVGGHIHGTHWVNEVERRGWVPRKFLSDIYHVHVDGMESNGQLNVVLHLHSEHYHKVDADKIAQGEGVGVHPQGWEWGFQHRVEPIM